MKPLLNTPKKTLLEYAIKHNITFFEDHSNLSDDYQRNKIRHHVIPYLIEENKGFLSKVTQYNTMMLEAFSFIRNNALYFLNGKNHFLLSEFKLLEPIIQKEVISVLLEQNNIDATKKKIISIIRFLNVSGPNDTYDVGRSMIFKRVYNQVLLTYPKEHLSFKVKLDLEGLNRLPDGSIIVFNSNDIETLNNEIVLCYNKLVLPLWARTRENGDYLVFPYGRKKLKDFFIDNKIPKRIRNQSIIITDNENEILAVLGLYVNTNDQFKDQIRLHFGRDDYASKY